LVGSQFAQRSSKVGAPHYAILESCALGALNYLNAEDRPPAGSHCAPTLVGDDRQEPGAERVAGPQVVEHSPGSNRCLLDRVLGRRTVVKHPKRQAKRLADQRPHELVKGRPITGFRPLDELKVGLGHHP
jgi:hypothetical protein